MRCADPARATVSATRRRGLTPAAGAARVVDPLAGRSEGGGDAVAGAAGGRGVGGADRVVGPVAELDRGGAHVALARLEPLGPAVEQRAQDVVAAGGGQAARVAQPDCHVVGVVQRPAQRLVALERHVRCRRPGADHPAEQLRGRLAAEPARRGRLELAQDLLGLGGAGEQQRRPRGAPRRSPRCPQWRASWRVKAWSSRRARCSAGCSIVARLARRRGRRQDLARQVAFGDVGRDDAAVARPDRPRGDEVRPAVQDRHLVPARAQDAEVGELVAVPVALPLLVGARTPAICRNL